MSERISSWQNLERKHEVAADQIGSRALKLVDARYGSGYPLWKGGRHELAYHNGYHSRMVGASAVKACMHYGMTRSELSLARAIGYSHDVVQLKGRGRDERESAEWFEAQLEKACIFPESARGIGGLAIRGTQPTFARGIVTGQFATKQEYPSKKAEQFALGVACGDFGDLYTPEGPYESHQLLREIKGMRPANEIQLDEMREFQEGQITLLEHFRYADPEGGRALATHKPQVIRYAHDTLKEMERGNIESWPDLIARDEGFMKIYR